MTTDWGGEYNNPDAQNTLIIFLSAIPATEDNFCFVSDCRNLFDCRLKNIFNEKVLVIFYSPSNALCSSDEFV